ncbi:hypothetical protein [Dapis sp. BLCC M126]|uniref:hypothetical protein n=1 Tax=Dapis sp. BLCC M126 TaxID=3400189 RepID=UPI003CEE7F1E
MLRSFRSDRFLCTVDSTSVIYTHRGQDVRNLTGDRQKIGGSYANISCLLTPP